jgi:hypothetical protein
MDIFLSEQTRVDKRIDEVGPQLVDIALQGRLVSIELHKVKNALKLPRSMEHNFLGSEISEDVSGKFVEIKNEFDVYAEKSSIVIKDLTKILTEIRHPASVISSFKEQHFNSMDSRNSMFRQKSVTIPSLYNLCHRPIVDIQCQRGDMR